MYIMGGFTNTATATSTTTSVESFDGGKWVYDVAMPTAKALMGCCVHNGAIILSGGQTTTATYSSTVHSFNDTTWTTLASLSNARAGMSSVSFNGNVYVFGGYNGANMLTTVSRFNGTSWTNIGNIPTARWRTCAVVYRNAMYVISGYTGLAVTKLVHSSTDGITWTSAPDISFGRSSASAAVYNDCIYVFGGSDGSTSPYSSLMQIFNGTSWTTVNGALTVTSRDQAAVVYNNYIYKAGGYPASAQPATTLVERFGPYNDPQLNQPVAVFNSSNSSNITIANSTTIGDTFTGGLSISAWVKYNTLTGSQVIVGKPASAANTSPFFNYALVKTGGNLNQFRIGSGASAATVNGNSAVTTGTWYHVVGTYDASSLRLYESGILTNTVASAIGVGTSTQSLKMGTNVINSELLNGYMRDVRIYNTVLDAGQVAALYNQTADKLNSNTAGTGSLLRVGRGVTGSLNASNGYVGYMDDIRLYNRTLTVTDLTGIWNGGTGSYMNGTDSSVSLARYNLNANTIGNQIGYYNNLITGQYFQAPTDIFLGSEAFTLSGKILTFTSNSSGAGYTWAVTNGTAWTTTPPYDTTGFTRVTSTDGGSLDDGWKTVALSTSFTFYGVSYSTCYIGTNGYITFVSGDGSIQTSLGGHYSQLRIAYYSCDLLPSASGTSGVLNYGYSGDKFVVTIQNMPKYPGGAVTDIANVQVALYLSNATSGTPGTIELNYGQCSTPGVASWIIGLSDRTNGTTPSDGSASVSLSASPPTTLNPTPTVLQSNISPDSAGGANMRIVSLNTGSLSATPYNLSVGLFGWWKMNESSDIISLDNSGSGLYMQMYPNATSNSGSGPHNQCSKLYNGVNEYSVTANNVSFPSFGASNSATISGWFRSSTATWLTTGAQCSQRTSSDSNTTAMFIHFAGTREIQPRFYSDAVTGHGPASIQPSDITQWNHICSTYNGFDIYTYINGILTDTTFDTFTIYSVNKPMFIGKDYVSGSNVYLPVETSDFRFYNRPLGQAEVTQLYNQSPQLHSDTPTGTQSLQLFGIPETRTARYSRWGEITPTSLNSSNSSGLTVTAWAKVEQLGNHTIASGRNWTLGLAPPRPDKLQAWYIGNESNTATTTAYNYGITETSAVYSTTISQWTTVYTGIYSYGIAAPYYNGSSYLQIDSGSGQIADALAGSQFTVSAWIYMDSSGGSPDTILSIATSGNSTVIYFYISSTDILSIRGPSGGDVVSSTTIIANTWTHVAATVNGTSCKLYVNGALVHTGTFGSSLSISGTDKIYAGVWRNSGGFSNYFTGFIGDIKLYNTELTATEITILYNAQYYPQFTCNTGSQSVLVANPVIPISANTWTHVGLTYDGQSSHASLYLNGKYVMGGSTSQNQRLILNTGGNVNIGARPGVIQPNNFCDNFQGLVSDIRVYSYELSSTEMAQIANGTYQAVARLDPYKPTATDGNLLAGLVDQPTKPIGRGTHQVRANSTSGGIYSPVISPNSSTGYDISLNGVSDYLTIGSSDYLTTAPSRVFTFMAWINPDASLATGTDTNIISKWTGTGTGNCYKVAYDFVSQLLTFSVGTGSISVTVSVSMQKGAYNHIACVCTGDRGQLLVYVNGRLMGTGTLTRQINISTSIAINIGRNATSPSGTYFKGQLCDIRFYEQALDQNTISMMMNSGTQPTTVTARLDTDNPESSGTSKKTPFLTSGLVAWINGSNVPLTASSRYLLNDNTPSNNRYIVNNCTLATGQLGNAILLTGAATSNIVINPTPLGASLLNTPFTCAMWTKFSNTVTVGADETLLQVIGTAGTTNNVVIDIRRALSGSNIVTSFGEGGDTGTFTQAIRDTNWHHLAVVYNGNTTAGTRVTYIDGTPYTSGGGVGPVLSAPTTWIIGNNSTGTSGANCAIEDFRVYNRALGIDEIKLLYGVSGSSQYQQLTARLQPPSAQLTPTPNRQPVYVSKYAIDNTGQVCDTPLPVLARDSAILTYNFQSLDSSGQVENRAPDSKPVQNYCNPAYLNTVIAVPYNPGVLAGGAAISNGVGRVNRNALYSPTSGNLTVSGIQMDMARDWTMAMWVYTANTTGAQDLWSANWSSPVTGFTNRLSSNSAVGNGLITYQLQSTTYASNAYLIPNTWSHLAISKGYVGTTANVVSIYQDGRLTYRNQIVQASQATQTMVWGANSGNQFTGYMDDIRLYNTRLNDTQIAKLATVTSTRQQSGAIHHWTADSTSIASNVIQDLGSLGACLKLNNVTISDSVLVVGGSAGNTSNIGADGRGSMYFSGASNAIAYGSRGLIGDQSRTVSFWMKRTTSAAPAGEESLVSWGDSTVATNWFNVMLTATSRPAVKTSAAATSNVQASMAVLDTSWHHVGVVVLPPGNNSIGGFGTERNIRIFIDGENRTNTATATNALVNTQPASSLTTGWVTLGSSSAGASNQYTGWLDDVRIYDMALTQTELKALYTGSSNYYRVA
jgi:N-acetylneuraminic acid mutarotase